VLTESAYSSKKLPTERKKEWSYSNNLHFLESRVEWSSIAKAMEFAIIETGGKQYKVSAGETVRVERIVGKKAGDAVVFDKVLLVDNGSDTTIGAPYITGASVSGTIAKEGRDAKVMVVKYKQKSRYLKRNGHRQHFMDVTINSIK
jgi:large subunit ribosomal protein L21